MLFTYLSLSYLFNVVNFSLFLIDPYSLDFSPSIFKLFFPFDVAWNKSS